MGWSADGRTLWAGLFSFVHLHPYEELMDWLPSRYFTDSFTNYIHAYDYDEGKVSGRRVFIDCVAQGLAEDTYPDGLCIDSEGGIWSARSVIRSVATVEPGEFDCVTGGAARGWSGSTRMES